MTLALRDDRLRSGRTGVRWRPAWRWPPETEAHVREILATCPRPILHVCAGASRLGDLRVDRFHPAADVKADMYQLPFPDGAFGTVVCDPPFPVRGTPVHERQRAFKELGRVVQPGGVVLLHAPWMPGSTWAVLEDVWVRHSEYHSFPFDAVLLTKWRRTAPLRGAVVGEGPRLSPADDLGARGSGVGLGLVPPSVLAGGEEVVGPRGRLAGRVEQVPAVAVLEDEDVSVHDDGEAYAMASGLWRGR